MHSTAGRFRLLPLFMRLYSHAAAKNFRVGISRFASVILIVRRNGEQRGVNARQPAGKLYDFISAEIYSYVYVGVVERSDIILNRLYVLGRFNHAPIISLCAFFIRTRQNTTKFLFRAAHILRICFIE